MSTATVKIVKRNLQSPDVIRDCGNGVLELVHLEDQTLGRFTLRPGWRWSEHVRPMAKTDYCEVPHIQYVISGRLMVVMEDGTKMELVPGDFVCIPPGHDAWVLGQEPFVAIDYSPAMKDYAKEDLGCFPD
jgi:quercetin dioxygenase-like cupin family protein